MVLELILVEVVWVSSVVLLQLTEGVETGGRGGRKEQREEVSERERRNEERKRKSIEKSRLTAVQREGRGGLNGERDGNGGGKDEEKKERQLEVQRVPRGELFPSETSDSSVVERKRRNVEASRWVTGA